MTGVQTCALPIYLAFTDTNNIDDVEMENNSKFRQVQHYFHVLDEGRTGGGGGGLWHGSRTEKIENHRSQMSKFCSPESQNKQVR